MRVVYRVYLLTVRVSCSFVNSSCIVFICSCVVYRIHRYAFSGGLITPCSEIKILGWSGPLR